MSVQEVVVIGGKQRTYPAILTSALAAALLGRPVSTKRCNKKGCEHKGAYVRVWLDPHRTDRFVIPRTNGTYYCSEHVHQNAARFGLGVFELLLDYRAYHALVLQREEGYAYLSESNPELMAR